MDPEKLKQLQALSAIMNGEEAASTAEIIRAMAVSVRTNSAVKLQEAGIKDPKLSEWAVTGKWNPKAGSATP